MCDRVYWAKAHLNVSGLIQSSKRGKFRITEEGGKVLKQNLSEIDDEYLLKYDGYVAFLERKRNGKKTVNDLDISISLSKELNTDLANELLNKLKKINFNLFEDLMLEFLFHIGYGHPKKVLKRT